MFQEICDQIWFIEGKNHGRYPYSNSLFINDRKKMLIDTGIGRSIIKKLIRRFGQPDLILYSHGHEDHIYDTDLFTAARYIHGKDKSKALSKKELFRHYGMNTPELQKILDSFLKSFHYKPLAEVNTFLNDQIFDLGSIQVKILHTPGHSAGHCCFEIVDENLIFSSDIDLTSFGPWYGGIDSDILEFQNSIQLLIQKNPSILVSSHKGVIFDNIIDLLERFLNKIQDRNEKILIFLEQEKTLNEIIPHALVHGKFYEPLEYYLVAEKIMLQKHLALLIEQNKIECKDGKYKTL